MNKLVFCISFIVLFWACASDHSSPERVEEDSVYVTDTLPAKTNEVQHTEIPVDSLVMQAKQIIFSPALTAKLKDAEEFLHQNQIAYELKDGEKSNKHTLSFEISINDRKEYFSFIYHYRGKNEKAKYVYFEMSSKLKPEHIDTCFSQFASYFSEYTKQKQFRFKKNWGIEGYVWTKEKSDYKQLILISKDHNQPVVGARSDEFRWVDTNEFLE